MERIIHTIPPVYDSGSKILILGSFPSVKSREGAFFYHHPHNRFWRIISNICGEPNPVSVDEKKRMLIQNKIAVWDIIESCEITGSSDSSIREVIPNDLSLLLKEADIREIFANGATAFSLYRKHQQPLTGRDAVKLPSTSPANASYSLDRLIEEWSVISRYLRK